MSAVIIPGLRFVGRDVSSAGDFTVGNFTIDAAPHDLDISSIVPANAKAIAITTQAQNNIISVGWSMRGKGTTNPPYAINLEAAAVPINYHAIIPLNNQAILTYTVSNTGVWTYVQFGIVGYWI